MPFGIGRTCACIPGSRDATHPRNHEVELESLPFGIPPLSSSSSPSSSSARVTVAVRASKRRPHSMAPRMLLGNISETNKKKKNCQSTVFCKEDASMTW